MTPPVVTSHVKHFVTLGARKLLKERNGPAIVHMAYVSRTHERPRAHTTLLTSQELLGLLADACAPSEGNTNNTKNDTCELQNLRKCPVA